MLPLKPPEDVTYAETRTALEAAGEPIGANDLSIAPRSRTLGLTHLTENLRKFETAENSLEAP